MSSDQNTPQKDKSLDSKECIIYIKGLKKSFGNNHVIRGLNFCIKKGEIVAVLGKSGSGKSILIKCIVGLETPDSGEIMIFGKNILKMNQKQKDEIRSRIGFLFQSNALYDSMTVAENLEFPLRHHPISKDKEKVKSMVAEALKSVGLSETQDLMPAELSGGMKKRIGIARTIIIQPEIILYDEPTTGLDPITANEISALMIKINEKFNTSSVIISHDISCIKKVAHRIVLLMDGINHVEGTYEQLLHSQDKRVRAFFE